VVARETKEKDEPKEEEDIKDDLNKIISLEEMNKMLKVQTPKKNTFDTYYRCLTDVYNHFKLNNIYELLTTKENEIINYIENRKRK
jgi:hypothetical protein